jgi:hypothetical protein
LNCIDANTRKAKGRRVPEVQTVTNKPLVESHLLSLKFKDGVIRLRNEHDISSVRCLKKLCRRKCSAAIVVSLISAIEVSSAGNHCSTVTSCATGPDDDSRLSSDWEFRASTKTANSFDVCRLYSARGKLLLRVQKGSSQANEGPRRCRSSH